MFGIGTPELLVILLIALIVVGPQRMPELARTIGKALREFRKVQDDVKGMMSFNLDGSEKPKPNGPRPGMAGAGGRPQPRVGPAARQADADEPSPVGAPSEPDPDAELEPDHDPDPEPEVEPGRVTPAAGADPGTADQ